MKRATSSSTPVSALFSTRVARARWAFPVVTCGVLASSFALIACGDDDFDGIEDGADASASSSSSSSSSSGSGSTPDGGGTDAGRPDGGDSGVDLGIASIQVYVDAFCPLSCTDVEVGGTAPLAARALDADGNEISGVAMTWTSADATIASVAADGIATGVSAGSVQVRATAGGVTGSLQLNILPSPITRVVVTPAQNQLAAVGDTVTLNAKAYNRLDQLVPDATFEWFTSDPSVGTVSAGGVFTSTGTGLGIVQAAAGYAAGWAQITVVSPISTRPATTFDQVSGGAHHACGLRAGVAYCWGYNYFGQAGNGEAGSVDGDGTPRPVLGGLTFTQINSGESHTCGITPTGAAYCWGAGGGGELGNGNPAERGSTTPIPVVGGHAFTQIAAGGLHTCGITTAGALYCWGWDGGGAVGTGVDTNHWSPQPIAAGSRYLDVATGLNHTCAVRDDHVVQCWGTNISLAVGAGQADGSITALPTAIGGERRFTSIDSFGSHTCGIEQDGSIWCWGRNDTGQAGNGETTDNAVPVKLQSNQTFVQVTTGAHHTCARTTTGSTVCVGDGLYGQLGGGLLDYAVLPQTVIGGLTFVDIEAGSHFTCGRLASKATYCWGASSTGQLGGGVAGQEILSPVPSPVVPVGP